MKKLLSRLGLLALVLTLIPGARAAFESSVVSADAQWVLHADLNNLRASVMGKELVAAAEKMQLDNGDMKIGIDVQKLLMTVGSVTAYGANFATDPKALDGILVIRGTPDLRKIAEAGLLQATMTTPQRVTEVKGLPFAAYSVSAGSAVQDAPTMEILVAFPPGTAVLVSKSKAQLLKANAVLTGSAPSLAKNPASALNHLIHNAGNAYLFAASIVPSDKVFTEDAPQARILQMANSGSVSLGEEGPQTYAHVELVAASEEMADKLVKILQGMTAMMSLAETNDKQLSEFLNSATVARSEKSVTLNLSYSSDRLVQMVKTLQEGRPRNVGRMPNNGRPVVDWKIGDEAAAADGLATKTTEHVHLTNGTTITILAKVVEGHAARLDRVEIIPAGAGSSPLVFRGEYMRLILWTLDAKPTSTGGKVVVARGSGATARFQFPGAEGDYTVKFFYVGEAGSNTTLSVSAKDPESATPAAKAQD